MDIHLALQGSILLLLLIASGFFSSAETALTTVNKIQMQLMAEEGSRRAKRVIWILDHDGEMLSAILIGNNIVNISASAFATAVTIELFGNTYIGAATGILTCLVLVFGEIIPKSLATVYSTQLSKAYSGIIWLLIHLLWPLIWIVERIKGGMTSLLGINLDEKVDVMTEDELKSLVDVGLEDGAIENDEFEMISNVFSLDDSLAKDIMVPRIDMVYVQADISQDELMKIYRETNYTRFPVYAEKRDEVIGTINMKDLLGWPEEEPFSVRKILREPHFTFEHKEVGTLLMEMRKAAISLVIVLDEYGATSGMITLEDILEEIVGEIRDEFDHDEKDAIRELKKDREYLVDGATNLDDVNDALGIHLTSEEYDSIGGYFIEYLDRLPKSGEQIELPDGICVRAELVRRNRIEKIHIFLPEQAEKK